MNKIWLAVVVWGVLSGATDARAGEAWYPAPQFRLTDQEGKPVTTADLKGKVWVVDFVFTRCGGACPVMTYKMIELASKVKGENVRFVSISVDPEYDTPAVLKQYAQRQGATDQRFVFLTGDTKEIYQLAKNIGAVAAPAQNDKPILHDEHFILIDKAGDVRGAYISKDGKAMEQLAKDVSKLAEPEWMGRFPVINASLNAASGILICLAMTFIQAKKVRIHAGLMIAAVVTSAAFLACYLTFHILKWQAGSATTRFPEGSWKPAYRVILISHSILAVVIVPLIFVTLRRAWKRRWDAHRRIAKPTFWLWLYVSATGVVVYWMLYQLAPRLPVVISPV